jgi:hypothetical protein
VLAVGAFIPVPFRSGYYVRSSLRTPTLHYIFIRASTSAPHGISSSILSLTCSVLSVPTHAISPPISSGCLHSCSEFTPIKKILSVITRNWGFSKSTPYYVLIVTNVHPKFKYNKDFLSIIFTDKKIKNLAKIRRSTQTNALGSKGQALRVFAIISTLRFTSVSILPKKP